MLPKGGRMILRWLKHPDTPTTLVLWVVFVTMLAVAYWRTA